MFNWKLNISIYSNNWVYCEGVFVSLQAVQASSHCWVYEISLLSTTFIFVLFSWTLYGLNNETLYLAHICIYCGNAPRNLLELTLFFSKNGNLREVQRARLCSLWQTSHRQTNFASRNTCVSSCFCVVVSDIGTEIMMDRSHVQRALAKV